MCGDATTQPPEPGGVGCDYGLCPSPQEPLKKPPCIRISSGEPENWGHVAGDGSYPRWEGGAGEVETPSCSALSRAQAVKLVGEAGEDPQFLCCFLAAVTQPVLATESHKLDSRNVRSSQKFGDGVVNAQGYGVLGLALRILRCFWAFLCLGEGAAVGRELRPAAGPPGIARLSVPLA